MKKSKQKFSSQRGASNSGMAAFQRVTRVAIILLLMMAFGMVSHPLSAQFVQQGNKLVGSGALGTNSQQGNSVSISSDGNTAILGAPCDSSFIGAAWVFTRSAGVWTQQGSKITGTGLIGSGPEFGLSAALSGDGNTAIFGAPWDNSLTGAAFIFTQTAGVWSQQGIKLVGSGAIGQALQGWSVSISADGNTAIVGGKIDSNNVGAAWVYTRTAGVWSQQGNKLVGTGFLYQSEQGFSVALSPDGNTAIIGGYTDSSSTGAAWIFTRTGGVWTQQGNKLVGTGAAGNAFQGTSVALSFSGDTAVVGGDGDSSSMGAVWVFVRSGGIWNQLGSKLIGTGSVNNPNQGASVAISADGNTIAEGGNDDYLQKGAIWMFNNISAGIEELNTLPGVTIFPNPASNILKVHLPIAASDYQIIITDLLGNTIYQQTLNSNDNSISISKWSEGIYFYEIRGEGQLNSDLQSARGKFVVVK